MKKISLIASVIAIAVASITSCQKQIAPEPAMVLQGKSIKNGDIIPGHYIVVLKNEAVNSTLRLSPGMAYDACVSSVRSFSRNILQENKIQPEGIVSQAYGKAIYGFAASLTDDQAARLKADRRVAYLEPDRFLILGGGKGKPGGGGGTTPTQTTPWGIARVGYASGAGKTAWIIDTGVDFTHPDLNVDVTRARTFVGVGPDSKTASDNNGHGTHVAGTIAAKNNSEGVIGVAYDATLVPVKVLDRNGSGAYSDVIAGVDYVAAAATPGDAANMSLGGPASGALDAAVLSAANNGVLFGIAAGNDGADANNSSPARVNHQNVFTVSAMDNADAFAYFSNFGNPPVDYCAPGVSIQSCWKGGAYNTISGTSMATPHVVGLLLLNGTAIHSDGYVLADPDGNADPIAHH